MVYNLSAFSTMISIFHYIRALISKTSREPNKIQNAQHHLIWYFFSFLFSSLYSSKSELLSCHRFSFSLHFQSASSILNSLTSSEYLTTFLASFLKQRISNNLWTSLDSRILFSSSSFAYFSARLLYSSPLSNACLFQNAQSISHFRWSEIISSSGVII